MRMAVVRRVARGEDHGAVEYRQDARLAARGVGVPQLEMPAVLLAPIAVQIEEKVQSPVEVQLGMDVEVGVNAQVPAALDLMNPAAAEIGIGDEPLDSGELLQEQQHLERIQTVEKVAHRARNGRALMVKTELPFVRTLESRPCRRLRRRELVEHGLQRGIPEET